MKELNNNQDDDKADIFILIAFFVAMWVGVWILFKISTTPKQKQVDKDIEYIDSIGVDTIYIYKLE